MDKTTTRIIKHILQGNRAGEQITIADIAKKYKVSQAAVFSLVVKSGDIDVEVGRVVDGKWAPYSSIGEYIILPRSDWSKLLAALHACKGNGATPAINETIDQLIYLLR
jgi:hypothetical protein